jgi:predicted MFS family arabinose efflux permease
MSFRLLIAVMFLGSFIAYTNLLALGPILVPIAEDIDSTVPLVGQAATISLILGAVIGLLLGPVSDHYGLRRALAVGAVLTALSGFGTALAFDYWSMLLTRIPAGIAGGMLLGLGISIISTRFPQEQRRSAITWVAGAAALAGIAGAPLLAILADITSWRAGFGLIGLFGAGLAVAYLRVVTPDPPIPNEPLRAFDVLGTYREILADVRMARLQVGNLFWSLVWIGAVTYLGAYLVEVVDVSLSTVGYLFMWGGFWFFVGNRSATSLARRWSPQLLMIPIGVLMSLSVAVFFAVSVGIVEQVLLLGLFGFAGGVGLPLILILIAEASTSAPGSVMMLRQFTWGIGAGFGAGVGGLMITVGGYPALGLGLAGFSILVPALVSFRTGIEPAPTPASTAND